MSDKYIFNLEKFQTLINNKDDFTKKDLLEDVGLSLNNISSILKAESLNEEHYER